MDDHSARFLRQWKEGDESAAEELFNRFSERLVALARSRLSEKLARRVGPEDVVQSAFRSFFREAANDRYSSGTATDRDSVMARRPAMALCSASCAANASMLSAEDLSDWRIFRRTARLPRTSGSRPAARVSVKKPSIAVGSFET